MGHAGEVNHSLNEQVILVGLFKFFLFFISVADQCGKSLIVAGTYHHSQQNEEADTDNEQTY